MNRKTLQKIMNELEVQNPRLDYVKGILETLIENLPEEKITMPTTGTINLTQTFPASGIIPNNIGEVEGTALDAMAAAKIAETKRIAGDY